MKTYQAHGNMEMKTVNTFFAINLKIFNKATLSIKKNTIQPNLLQWWDGKTARFEVLLEELGKKQKEKNSHQTTEHKISQGVRVNWCHTKYSKEA